MLILTAMIGTVGTVFNLLVLLGAASLSQKATIYEETA
jgi:hypothetical protein